MHIEPTLTQQGLSRGTPQISVQQNETVDLTITPNHRPASRVSSAQGSEQQIKLSSLEQSLIHAVSDAAKDYKRSEGILVLHFCELAKTQAFKKCGYPNLFTFAVKHLGLTEGTAYQLVKVAKKSLQIPLIIQAMTTDKLSLRTVGRLVPVLTTENAATLFARAKTMTSRELERLVATLNPRLLHRDHRFALNGEDTRVSVTLNQPELATLMRCQELLMQKKQGAVTLAETVAAISADYLKRHSPEQKATRAENRWRKKEYSEKMTTSTLQSTFKEGSCQEKMTNFCTESEKRGKNCDKILAISCTRSEFKEKSDRENMIALGTEREMTNKTCDKKISTSPPQSGFKEQSYQENMITIGTESQIRDKTCDGKIPDQTFQSPPTLTIDEITPNPKNPRFVPAKIVHFVGYRDQHRCAYVNQSGERCGEKKFLHLHHIKPLSEGGNHHPDNLTQLCAYHHDLVHQLSFFDWAQGQRSLLTRLKLS